MLLCILPILYAIRMKLATGGGPSRPVFDVGKVGRMIELMVQLTIKPPVDESESIVEALVKLEEQLA